MCNPTCQSNKLSNFIPYNQMSGSFGADGRISILPSKDPGDPGFLGPNYDPSDFIPLPGDLGVKRGSSVNAVLRPLRALSYYADTIGFGEASIGLTRGTGVPVMKYGISYFVPTGMTCDNGAQMFDYVDTIPKGDALGKAVQRGMASSGFPQLRGLAPGIVEDAKAALNPVPIVKSLFGTGYAKCKLAYLPVGDLYGRIGDEDGPWIMNPETARMGLGGRFYQTRWVLDRNITKDEFDAAPKQFEFDGSPRKPVKEEFCGKPTLPMLGVATATLLVLFAMKMRA